MGRIPIHTTLCLKKMPLNITKPHLSYDFITRVSIRLVTVVPQTTPPPTIAAVVLKIDRSGKVGREKKVKWERRTMP